MTTTEGETPTSETPAQSYAQQLLAFAEHQVTESIGLRCEITDTATHDRCAGRAVAVRWEMGFADDVCDRHAQTATTRGALVVYPDAEVWR